MGNTIRWCIALFSGYPWSPKIEYRSRGRVYQGLAHFFKLHLDLYVCPQQFLSCVQADDGGALGGAVFASYISLMRRIQTTYWWVYLGYVYSGCDIIILSKKVSALGEGHISYMNPLIHDSTGNLCALPVPLRLGTR